MEFSDKEMGLLRALQEDLPVCERPYADLALRAGMSEAETLETARRWKESGVIRRMGAFIRHRKAGVNANGMVVWDVPEERIEEAGRAMSARECVSHCYARPRSEKWPFRLYAMMHGATENEVREQARLLSEELHIDKFRILFSLRELKKSDTKLFMEEDR
jgi:DNA-binding Lrp family transcriptional regulator